VLTKVCCRRRRASSAVNLLLDLICFFSGAAAKAHAKAPGARRNVKTPRAVKKINTAVP
jgi:hypothetical protein